ncbi:YcjF family protein [Methylobacterium sp. EM32]|uniref:YcjF family protein n=1 Tax=Methylobacterium sp. EM32 TaxID=3163481 RepID=UPI00339FC991
MASETTSELAKTVDAALPTSRREQVDQIIRKYTLWSAGLGLIPLPVLDVAAVATAQYKMVGELAKLYDLPFSQERVRVLVGSLLGSGLPAVLAGGGIGSLAKSIPLVGTLAGAAVMPALSAAATIALARVFVQHFEAGGTLLDFEPETMKSYFKTEFERAQNKAGAATATPPEPVRPESPKNRTPLQTGTV